MELEWFNSSYGVNCMNAHERNHDEVPRPYDVPYETKLKNMIIDELHNKLNAIVSYCCDRRVSFFLFS